MSEYITTIRKYLSSALFYINLHCPDCNCHEVKLTDDKHTFICVNCKRRYTLEFREIK